MSGTYVQCSSCGKRALSVATRCPRCGHEFPPRRLAARRPLNFGRYVAPLAVLGVVVAGIALVMAVIGRTRRTHPQPVAPVAAATPDSARAAAPLPAGPGQRRFARTWTKVRTRRSTRADVAAVLLPGDTVLVDSLSRGWWRVTSEDSVLGYAHQSTLETEPPAPGR